MFPGTFFRKKGKRIYIWRKHSFLTGRLAPVWASLITLNIAEAPTAKDSNYSSSNMYREKEDISEITALKCWTFYRSWDIRQHFQHAQVEGGVARVNV